MAREHNPAELGEAGIIQVLPCPHCQETGKSPEDKPARRSHAL